MPISSNASSIERKRALKIVNKVLTPSGGTSHSSSIPQQTTTVPNALAISSSSSSAAVHVTVTLHTKSDGSVHVLRGSDKCFPTTATSTSVSAAPLDRLSLDRCSLTRMPHIAEDSEHLRLFSLQHNLIAHLAPIQSFPQLVFLDVYDNEIEQIDSLSGLSQLRVFLAGKNRIQKIVGLESLSRLEVLDLHGNQIAHITGLHTLGALRVLNLASNKLTVIAQGDLKGLNALNELNLKRNSLKTAKGFEDVPILQKLFLSNNDIKKVDDMISVLKSVQLRELTLENNPVAVTSDCISFFVAQLQYLALVNGIQVTENFRKTALVWKRNKLQSLKFNPNAGRDKIISNAKTNWELLRTQSKYLTAKEDPNIIKPAIRIQSSIATNSNKIPLLPEPVHTRFPLPFRSNSQDTNVTESSVTSSQSTNPSSDAVYFPPIIASQQQGRDHNLGATPSVSSNDAHVDSSLARISASSDIESSTSSDESDADAEESGEEDAEVGSKEQVEHPDQRLPRSISNAYGSVCSGISVSVSSGDGTGSELSQQSVQSVSGSQLRRNARSAVVRASTAVNHNRQQHSYSGRHRRPVPVRAMSSKVTTLPRSGSAAGSCKSRSPSVVTSSSSSTHTPVTAPPLPSATTVITSTISGSSSNSVLGPAAGSSSQLRDKEQGGDYLVEICGRHLNIYGQGALRHLDKAWNPAKASDVQTVNFHYANFNGIAATLSRLKHRFPNTVHLALTGTGISTLAQLNALAELQGLTTLFIHEEGNPLVQNLNWRTYAIYRLGHWGLKVINGIEITAEEDKAANEEYRSLGDLVLRTLPDAMLEPLLTHLRLDMTESETIHASTGKRRALLPALKSVIAKEALQWKKNLNTHDEHGIRQKSRLHIGAILTEMVHSQLKLQELERTWPQVLRDLVQNSLLDFTQFDAYKKQKLQQLS